ncbi:iron chelate uptake ABC transporter family permease subunit [Pseudohalioglobus sediminis]|uniref:Iron chelate uptake ABC transporter family permease subunit n=1 Tax=Pseudohalioglobus sediminis TaxID=2606449 RepID=A0A5B0X636_9GAMM|nr:iron chelate uptake ABC transporter family permease subunit [Pseudohalioglobus sediminis]KAA1194135.1 iron chelate uptake ABC transporter family permease subunit [Pseudohalioglobus sediminis]
MTLSRAHSARRLIILLLVLLPLALLAALALGSVSLGAGQLLQALGHVFSAQYPDHAAIIIGQIRLPRALLAALVGALLATSGAAMQGIFRNPLADPSLIGVTAGASLGASLVIAGAGSWIVGISGLTLVSLGAFAGGMLAVVVVYRLASSDTGTSVATMLLAGIAITALAGALGNVLELSSSNEVLRRISLWRMGGLDGADYPRVVTAMVVTAVVLWILPRHAQALNALLLGESEARYLGIDVERTKTWIVVTVAVAVGAGVALAGTIAFVGLVIPHIVRLLIGPDHRYLLPAAALAGAILLVFADILARTLVAPAELPVGIVTACIGVPFFISLLHRRRDYGMQ